MLGNDGPSNEDTETLLIYQRKVNSKAALGQIDFDKNHVSRQSTSLAIEETDLFPLRHSNTDLLRSNWHLGEEPIGTWRKSVDSIQHELNITAFFL